MTFALVTTIENFDKANTATTGTITAPSAGDLVVLYINSNNASTVSLPSGGSTFTQLINEQPGTNTANQGLFWKIAGAGEPTAYTVAQGASRSYWLGGYVFSSAADAEVNAPANAFTLGTSQFFLRCEAYDGQVISDDAVAVVFGGKDNRDNSGEIYTTVGESYIGVIGTVNSRQIGGGAYRIYTTGETGVGSVNIDTADADDGVSADTYSVHVSFVESGGAAGNSVSRLTLLGVN